MKKNQLLKVLFGISFATMLMSCAGNESSPNEKPKEENSSASSKEEIDLNAALSKAKEAIHLEGDLTSIYVDDGDSYEEGDIDVTITDDFFEWNKTFKDSSSNEVNFDYTFTKNASGNVCYDRLNIMNEVVNIEYENPSIDGGMKYNSYCFNPFNNLFADDLTLIEGRYYVSEERINDFAPFLSFMSTTEYKMYTVQMSSVSLSYQNGKFKDLILTSSPQSDGLLNPADFFFDATFDLLFPGKDVAKDEVKAKEHKKEHDTLQGALNKLQETIKAENYTITADDEESGGDYSTSYDNYATSEGFYSDFKPLIYNYKFGYKKQSDGKYRRFIDYVSGDNKGTQKYDTNSSKATQERKDLEPQFTSFAPEFFVFNSKTNVFSTTTSMVVDEIKALITPFYDKQDVFLNATKVFFNLDSSNEVSSWGIVVYDFASGYTDTITYTFKDIGTTTLPTLIAD